MSSSTVLPREVSQNPRVLTVRFGSSWNIGMRESVLGLIRSDVAEQRDLKMPPIALVESTFPIIGCSAVRTPRVH